ncbi:MAG: S-methyl-5'-thioadenosine phosphorylase [Phycisphaerales bacterium]|nr:S-methyl-5'-thioadenosine phosphorylase [Phycisphaerales bacterium]
MNQARIGIIGGSGLGQAFAEQVAGREVQIDTPFGSPSGPILLTSWQGVDIAFLSRHGPGHLLNPSTIPYRANLFALKQLGVTHVIASGATGSLREEFQPRHLVVCDQLIDRTYRRENTFFDSGMVAHVEFAEPFCPMLRQLLIEANSGMDTVVHPAGTYICMEGPAFSTAAESRMHRQIGGDLIGMTALPEAKLAREAEMCYTLLALPTDYDSWRPHEPGMDRGQLLAEIIGNLQAATENAIALLRSVIPALATRLDNPCPCREALQLAIWSDKKQVHPADVNRLRPLVARYFPAPPSLMYPKR